MGNVSYVDNATIRIEMKRVRFWGFFCTTAVEFTAPQQYKAL